MVRKRRTRRPVQPNTPKRRLPKRGRNRKSNVGHVDPFIGCVFGPVDHPGEGVPCPDGATNPTVVVEHRQTLVLRPRPLLTTGTTGSVSFALVSSPFGAISIGDARANLLLNRVDWYTKVGGGSNAPNSGVLKDPNYVYDPEVRDFDASFDVIPVSESGSGPGVIDPVTGLCTLINAWYQTVPFSENIYQARTTTVDKLLETGLQPTRFRVLTTVADVNFTGSSLDNGGVATTGRTQVNYNDDKPIPYPGAGIAGAVGPHIYLTSTNGANSEYGVIVHNEQSFGRPFFHNGVEQPVPPPTSFGAVAALPGSRTFPARESVHMINPPSSFEFQDLRKQWTPYYVQQEGADQEYVTQNPANGSDPIVQLDDKYPLHILCFAGAAHKYYSDQEFSAVRALPIPGLGAAPVSYYYAQGLSDNATITITVRTCVEYQLAFSSPSARFARLPPPERPLALKAVGDIGKKLPSSAPITAESEQTGWLGRALGWYGNTMKNIIGASWNVGLNVARHFLPNTGDIASLIGGTRNLSIRGTSRPAIGW